MSIHRPDLENSKAAASQRSSDKSHSGLGRFVGRLLDNSHVWFQTSGKGRPVYLWGRMSLGLVVVTGLLLLGAAFAFAMSEPAAAGMIGLFAIGSGLCSLGCLAVGVSLEMLIETPQAAVIGRSLRMAATEVPDSESINSGEQRRRAA